MKLYEYFNPQSSVSYVTGFIIAFVTPAINENMNKENYLFCMLFGILLIIWGIINAKDKKCVNSGRDEK